VIRGKDVDELLDAVFGDVRETRIIRAEGVQEGRRPKASLAPLPAKQRRRRKASTSATT
jgi:hypothetical protein